MEQTSGVENAPSGRKIVILINDNIDGYVTRLWDTLQVEGWLDLYPITMVMFADVGLPEDSDDRTVWRFAQAHQMLLLTANRNMDGADSLEQTLREENKADSLPVLTITNAARLQERIYREECAERLLEILLDIDNLLGAARLYIP
ncbi:MAG: hypothetical protein U0350_28980 [Caldilineaceae bacterium]